jgi:hypothetical protein
MLNEIDWGVIGFVPWAEMKKEHLERILLQPRKRERTRT